MGYHIVNLDDNKIEHFYIESKIELAYLSNITENTIIYQGEKHWIPIRFGDEPSYNNYIKDWFRAGLKAQESLKKQSLQNKLMLEELFQDEDSFKNYLIFDEYFPIKRGDFLVRNYGNIEVDIKCRSFYKNKNEEIVFNFKCDDVERHLNMQTFTKTTIMIAVYERNGDQVIEDIPFIFSIEGIDFETLGKVYVKTENTGFCYQIPLRLTTQSFDYIKEYNTKKKVYSIIEKRKEHANAYKKWTTEEDNVLELYYCKKNQ